MNRFRKSLRSWSGNHYVPPDDIRKKTIKPKKKDHFGTEKGV